MGKWDKEEKKLKKDDFEDSYHFGLLCIIPMVNSGMKCRWSYRVVPVKEEEAGVFIYTTPYTSLINCFQGDQLLLVCCGSPKALRKKALDSHSKQPPLCREESQGIRTGQQQCVLMSTPCTTQILSCPILNLFCLVLDFLRLWLVITQKYWNTRVRKVTGLATCSWSWGHGWCSLSFFIILDIPRPRAALLLICYSPCVVYFRMFSCY